MSPCHAYAVFHYTFFASLLFSSRLRVFTCVYICYAYMYNVYISHTQLFSFRRAQSSTLSFSVAPSVWNAVSRVHRSLCDCLYARSDRFKCIFYIYIKCTHTTTRPPAHIPMHFLSSFVVNPSRTENIHIWYIINTCTVYTVHTCMNTSHSQHISTCKHIRNCTLITHWLRELS